MSIYVCSDLHGQYTLFMKLLEKINFSDNDTMYIIGDLIDRGPKGIKLLKYLMNKNNIICTIGNHEHMMWSYYRGHDHDYAMAWKHPGNGGDKTRNQFNNLNNKEQNKLLDYIENMYLQIEVKENNKTFLLSHSSFIIDKNTTKWKDCSNFEVERTLWYSPWRQWEHERFEHYNWDNRIHVIGHVPVQRIIYEENYNLSEKEQLKQANKLVEIIKDKVINIDGGCAYKSKNMFSKAGIICMNLSEYAHDNKDSFIYINS